MLAIARSSPPSPPARARRSQAARLTALVVFAACAAPAAQIPEARPDAPATELHAVAREMTAIDAAAGRGELGPERERLLEMAADRRKDLAAQFLALYAAEPNNDTWLQFKVLAESAPLSAWGHVGMGRIYLEWGALDQAVSELETALQKEPRNWIAMRLRGEASLLRGNDASAKADFAAVLQADPESPEAYLGLARLAKRAGDSEAMKRAALAALRSVPGLSAAELLLGEQALARGDRAEAAQRFRKASASSPRHRDSRLALARFLTESGDHAGALTEWRAALALKDDLETARATARSAWQVGDGEVELDALMRVARHEVAGAALWRRVAELQEARKDSANAEKALQHALEADPNDVAANASMARVHLSRGELGHALTAMRKAGASKAEQQTLQAKLNIQPIQARDIATLQREVEKRIVLTYRERLKISPQLRGALKIRVMINNTGQATEVEVLEDAVRDDWVRACAYWNLNDAGYPREKAGRYAFTFDLRP